MKFNKLRKFLYIIITYLLLICCTSIFDINAKKKDQVVLDITPADFAQSVFENGSAVLNESGESVSLIPNGTVNVYLPTAEEEINGIEINLAKPVENDTQIVVFYSLSGDIYSDGTAAATVISQGDDTAVISIDSGVYAAVRLDVNSGNSNEISSVKLCCRSDEILIDRNINLLSLSVAVILLVAMFVLNKQIQYIASIISFLRKRFEIFKDIKGKRKIGAAVFYVMAEVLKLVYLLYTLYFISKGAITWYDMIVMFILSAVLLVITFAEGIVIEKISCEKLFLSISIISGVMLSCVLPVAASQTWDGQIHYANSMSLCALFDDVEFSETDNTQCCYAVPIADYMHDPESVCKTLIYNDRNLIPSPIKPATLLSLYNHVGYTPFAVTMFMAHVFNMNHISMIMMAKLSMGLLWSFVVYSGMKRLKKGKYIMAAIALIPGCLFLANNYSYDPWVLMFTMYSFAYLISELQQPEKTLTVKDMVLMLGSMFLGCGPKAIYFFMLLPFLFIQKGKFNGDLTRKKYVAATVLTACVIAASFALPMLIGGVGSDMRGGEDVNGPEQVKFILTHPLDYTVILLRFMNGYASVGNLTGWFNSFAYLGSNAAECSTVTFILLVLAAFWDKSECDKFKHMLAFKLTTYFTLFVQVALICTALYISFTPVASESIGGVQGRYLFPLLFPFLYCLGSAHTKTAISSKFMNSLIFGGCTLNIIWCTYSVYITQLIK